MPTYEILGILILLAFSAFFSSAETALTALSEGRTRQIQDERPRLRPYFQRWLDHTSRFIATILVGNNIVKIAASVLGAHVAHLYLERWADAVAIAAMTFLVLAFGEVSPKVFAKRTAPYWATRVIRPLCFLDSLLRPLSWLFGKIGKATARTAGAAGLPTEEPTVTETEIEHMIDLGEREGVLAAEHSELLRSALGFEDTVVKEVMVPRTEMVALDISANLREVLALVNGSRHSRFPVYREVRDKIVGTLHVKDLVAHVGQAESCDSFDWTQHVRPNPMFVPETQKVSKLLRDMQTRRLHLAIVVDEFGGTSGFVTLEDILEEIVGEIQDEYDAEEPLIVEQGAGRFLADARVPLWDLGQRLHTEFPTDVDYETLGGFVTHHLHRVPERGAHFEWNGFDFTVRDADARRVRRVEITARPAPPLPPEDGSDAGDVP